MSTETPAAPVEQGDPAPPDDEPRRDLLAAPLSRASRVELAVRVLAAAVVTVDMLLALWGVLHGPRFVDDRTALLRDAAAGRVVRVDRSPGSGQLDRVDLPVLWRTRDAEYYSEYPVGADAFGGGSVKDAVRAQPYVATHPDSVTFGAIDQSRRNGPIGRAGVVVGLLALVPLIRGPQPRLLTKWAWGVTFTTGVGLVAYLLLAGSWRTRLPRFPDRRVNGWVVWGASALVSVVVNLSGVVGAVRGVATPRWHNDAAYVVPGPR